MTGKGLLYNLELFVIIWMYLTTFFAFVVVISESKYVIKHGLPNWLITILIFELVLFLIFRAINFFIN